MPKKLSMQEMGLDDELNIPEMNFDQPNVSDDRSPSTKLADGIRHGAKATLSNPKVLGNVIRKALPREYGETADAVEDVTRSVRETYEDASNVIRPAAAELARSVEKMVPESAKRTRQVLQKIGKWDKKDAVDQGPSAEQQRNTGIAMELDAIFAQRDKEQQKDAILEDSKSKVQQGLDLVRHQDQMVALNKISVDLSSINQYTNKITSAYQRKSLELQYRSYYVQADLLAETRKQAEIVRQRLDSINKNTGLPDYVKLRNSERLGETMRNQFADSLVGGLMGDRNEFLKRMGQQVRTKVMETVRGVGSAMSMGAMGADMYNMMDELDDFQGGPKRGMMEKGASAGTSWMLEKFAYDQASKAREKFQKHEGLAKGAAWLGDKVNNGLTDLNEARYGGSDDDPLWKRFGRGVLDFIMPNMRPSGDLQTDQLRDGRNAAVFNNFTNKSINEVIPGYLSRILREVNILRTGDDSVKLMTYDFSSNKFANSADYVKKVKDQLVSPDARRNMSQDIREKLEEIEEASGGKFTAEERQKIAEFMMRSAASNRSGSAARLGNADTFRDLDLGKGGADRVADMFRKYFEVDADGKVANTAEAWRRESNFKTWHSELPRNVEDVRGLMQDLVNSGQLDILREAGYVDDRDGVDVEKLMMAYIDMGKDEDDPSSPRRLRRKYRGGPMDAVDKESLKMDEKLPTTAKRRRPNNVTPPVDPTKPHSDVTLKENIKKFQPNKALDALKGIGVSSWNYKLGSKANDGGFQHYGPMAQDVNKVLGQDFAPDGKKLDLVNMNGMTMQAIKDVDAKVDANPLLPLTQTMVEKLKVANLRLASMESILAAGHGLKYQSSDDPEKNASGIRKALLDMSNLGNNGEKLSVVQRFKKMFGIGGGLAADGLEVAGDAAMSVHRSGTRHAKAALEGAGWAGGKITDGLAWAGNKAWDRMRGIADIYYGMEKHPRITKAKLMAGEYYDQKSGEVITKFNDIRGAIIDKDGNIVLSAEEVKDAFMRTTVVGKVVKLGTWVKDQAIESFDAGNRRLGIIRRAAVNLGRSALEFAGDVLDVPRDVYVKGETKPRLIAILMKGGRYVNEDGKPIRRPSDIRGPIKDGKTNRYLITEDDLKKGLVDEKGEKLATPLAKLTGMAVAGVSKVFNFFKDIHQNGLKGLQGLLGVGRDAWAGVMNALSHGLGFGRALPVLEQIRDILDKRLPVSNKKKILGDQDGDGKRDNGVEAMQERNEERKKAIRERLEGRGKGNDPRKYETKNTFDLIAEKAAAAKDGIMGMFGGGDGVDIDINGDGKDDKKPKKGKKLSPAQRRAEAMARMEKKTRAAERAAKIAKMTDKVKALPGAGKVASAGRAIGTAASALPGAGMVASAASKLPSLATIGTAAGAAGTAAGAMGRGALNTLGKPYGGLRLAGQGLWGGAKMLGKGAVGLGKGALWAGSKLGALGSLGIRALPGLGLGYGLYSGYNDLKEGNYGSAAMNLGLAGLSGATMVGGLGAAGALAGTVLGAVFSPVVLGAAAIGAAGYLGYKIFKWATKKKFDEISLLRMAQYGLLQGDDDLHQKVAAFEELLTPLVTYDSDGTASLQEKEVDQKKIMEIFDITEADQDGKERLAKWISERFKPTFLTHLTAAKKLNIEGGIDGSDKAPLSLKMRMLDLVAMPEGPWGMMTAPFKDVSRLGAGPQTVQAIVDALRAKYAKDLKEGKGKEERKDPLKEEAKVVAALSATAAMDKAAVGKLDAQTTATASAKADAQAQRQDEKISSAVKKLGPAGVGVAMASEGARTMATVTSDPGEKYMGGNVSALEAVKMRAYGLKEMDAQRVIAMRSLEALVTADIKVGADYSASWTGDLVELVKKARKFFILGVSDEGQTATWTEWFLKRFLPTYTAYLGGLFQLTLKNRQETAESAMTAGKSVMLAGKLIALSSVWRVVACPWRDYQMCMDTRATDGNLAILKEQAKEERLREEQARKEGPKPAALPANKFPVTAEKTKAENAILDAKKAAMDEGVGQSHADDAEDPVRDSKGGGSTVTFTGAGGSAPPMAAGDISNGSGADQYLKVDKGESLDGVNPEFLRLFRGMVQEYGELTGKSVTVGAGKRTYEMQAALYKKDPKKAAPPGRSLHEVGLAIDASSETLNHMEKLGLLKKYGLTRPVGKEPWHVEPAGIQTDITGNRADAAKATAAVTAGIGKGGGGWGTVEDAVKYTRNPEMAKKLLNAVTEPTQALAQTPAKAEQAKAEAKPAPGTPAAPKAPEPTQKFASADQEPKGGMGGGGGGGAGGSAGITEQPKPGDAAEKLRQTVPGSGDGYQKMATAGKGGGWNAVSGVITDAANLVGVDKNELATIAGIESNFNPNAKNEDSSATGLFQFIKKTWRGMLAKYGKQYGIPMDTPPTDPKANAIMGALFLRDNKKGLASLKSNVNGTDAYMAHFLGLGAAQQFFSMKDEDVPAKSMPDQAAVNKSIFYANGRPRTKAEIYALMEKKVNTAGKRFGFSSGSGSAKPEAPAATQTAAATTPDSGFMKTSFNPSTTEETKPAIPVPAPATPRGQQPAAEVLASVTTPVTRTSTRKELPQIDPQRQQVLESISSVKSILSSSLTVQENMLKTLGEMVSTIKDANSKAAQKPDVQMQQPQSKVTAPAPVPSYKPNREPVPMARPQVSMQHQRMT